jgi:hypothetical protein
MANAFLCSNLESHSPIAFKMMGFYGAGFSDCLFPHHRRMLFLHMAIGAFN